MEYIKVSIATTKAGTEEVLAVLMNMGIQGAEVYDPDEIDEIINKKNEYDWDYIDESIIANKGTEHKVILYLNNDEEGKKTLADVKVNIMMLKSREMEGLYGWDADFGRLYVSDEVLDDGDWKNKWKEYFKPAKVTEKIVIKPTWEEYEKQDGDIVLTIDPGMAFGTGTHETTSSCLAMIEKYITEDSKVLDVGCGSGILSIGAALLGSSDVLGIDIDDEAVRVSKENAELNGVSDAVRIQKGDLTKGVDFKADIIAANLAANLVILFSPDVKKHLNPDGIYISSGIIEERKDQVMEALTKEGFEIVDVIDKGEWTTIGAKYKGE